LSCCIWEKEERPRGKLANAIIGVLHLGHREKETQQQKEKQQRKWLPIALCLGYGQAVWASRCLRSRWSYHGLEFVLCGAGEDSLGSDLGRVVDVVKFRAL
jgi:hypothetical protein